MEDGSFEVKLVEGVARAIRTMTWSEAQRVRATISEAQSKESEATPESIIEAIEAVSPELGKIARTFGASKPILGFIMIVTMMVLHKCTISLNVDIDVDDIIRELRTPQAELAQDRAYPPEAAPEAEPPPADNRPRAT